jgi:DNA-binding XRE family transcriptional regulator
LKDKAIKIGKVIERLRRTKQLAQDELAFHCDITRRSMSSLETDQHLPSLMTFIKIAIALEMKPHELMKEIERNVDLSDIYKEVEDKIELYKYTKKHSRNEK